MTKEIAQALLSKIEDIEIDLSHVKSELIVFLGGVATAPERQTEKEKLREALKQKVKKKFQ